MKSKLCIEKTKGFIFTAFLLLSNLFFAQSLQKQSNEKLLQLADTHLKTPIKKIIKSNGDVYLQRNVDAYLSNTTKPKVYSKKTGHLTEEEFGCNHNEELLNAFLNRPQPSVATLNNYFNQAALEFKVPVEILKAVGQVQSNWVQISTSVYGSWGVMGLIDNEFNNQIGVAARLLNVDSNKIKNDSKTNIRAAAALLNFYQGKNPKTTLDNWFLATRELTGLNDEEMKTSLAMRFFKVIKDGSKTVTLWKEIIDINGNNMDLPVVPANLNRTVAPISQGIASNVDYAGALPRITSCNFGNGRNGYGIDYYFVHYMSEGTYEGAISYFNQCRPSAPTSAHYCIRNSDGQISQVVRESDRSYSQGVVGSPQWNGAGVSTEHEVLATNLAMWDSQPMLNAAAALAIDVCNRNNVPKIRRSSNGVRGIYGHNDVGNTDCPNLTQARWTVLLNKIQNTNTLPVANFTSSSTSVCSGNTVTYTSTSTGATSYNWTFAGGTPATSTAQNPTVTYSTVGTYTTTLKAINANGNNTKTATNLITVGTGNPITASFTATNTEIATGESVTFNPSSTGATLYTWTFPGGSPSTSNAANPSVTFSTAGTKTITLVSSNSCNSLTKTIDICVGTTTKLTLETFESTAGRFTSSPTTSGSTVGIATTSTLARATDSFKNGTASLKAVMVDNTASTSAWTVRILSGGGTPANNAAFVGNQGTFGFWFKTSTAASGATLSAWIDDVDGTEELPPLTINNNGAWNYYEWFLPNAVGATITTGNGRIDGASVTLDGIVIKQNNTANTMTAWIDDISHSYISGCGSGVRRITEDGITSNESSSKLSVSIYPNPSKGQVTVLSNLEGDSIVKVISLTGQLILEKTFDTSEMNIDLNGYEKGIYILQITSQGNVITKKIVLE